MRHFCYKMLVKLSKVGLDDHEYESHRFEIWCLGDSTGTAAIFSCL